MTPNFQPAGAVMVSFTLPDRRQATHARLYSPFSMHCYRRFNGVAAPGVLMRTLPLLDELEAALASGSIARRIDILSRLTDLFLNGAEHYSEDQVGIFDDVM